jgi:hypothetical protein
MVGPVLLLELLFLHEDPEFELLSEDSKQGSQIQQSSHAAKVSTIENNATVMIYRRMVIVSLCVPMRSLVPFVLLQIRKAKCRQP